MDRFDLLRPFFSEISVPGSEWQEPVMEGERQTGPSALISVLASSWVLVVSVNPETRTRRLLWRAFDPGEADVLALVDQSESDLVLLDESVLWQRAKSLDLRTSGMLGVLLRAKRDGRINQCRPDLGELRAIAF